MPKRNYHMLLDRAAKPPIDSWRCDYCGETGPLAELQASDCSHVYEPCKTCGGDEESNECKPDCAAIWEALAEAEARPDVYVVGSSEGDA